MREIDSVLCDGCGGKYLCVRECPTGYIAMADELPTINKRGRCINCGHCVAVCPTGAVTEGNELPQTIEASSITSEELLDFFKSKRSVRFFDRDRSVEEKKVEAILAAGQTAPTDMNRSTVRVLLIKEELPVLVSGALEYIRGKLEPIGAIHPQYYGFMKEYNEYDSKGLLLAGAEYLVAVVGGSGYAVDAGITAERMQLMAHSLGIATLYRGNLAEAFTRDDALRERLGLKKNETVHVTFVMGYADFQYVRVVEKQNKKVERR